MKKLTEKQITRLFAALKQERPEREVATQEVSYFGVGSGDEAIIIKGLPSNKDIQQLKNKIYDRK